MGPVRCVFGPADRHAPAAVDVDDAHRLAGAVVPETSDLVTGVRDVAVPDVEDDRRAGLRIDDPRLHDGHRRPTSG